MNEPARQATFASAKPAYPVGSIIVREKLLNLTGQIPELLVVMIKREKGFNPAAGDWEFLTADGNATRVQQRERTGSCQQCHASQKERDFVMGSYVK